MTSIRLFQIALVGMAILSSSACRSPYYADHGAALGGVAGGLTGAALGNSSGNALGGALLGTAVGALAGGAIGDSMDAELERRQALIEARTGRRMPGAVTLADVKTLTTSGLSEDVIVNHIQANGVAAPLTPRDIIQLHESGVSENVINAMQHATSRPVGPAPVHYATPVIIEESYVVPSYWHPRPYYYGPVRHRHYPPRPGVSWGFSYAR
jgi:hypothetical protein